VNQVGGDQERAGGPLKSGLLLTKLYAPAPREQMVARDRLLERLRPRADAKLTLVAAPAGCGKTTLLAAWYEDEARRRPVAWVTVDDGDNDAVVFWCHILEALRRVRPELAVSPRPQVAGSAGIVSAVLPSLVNELVELGDVALVLDDFQSLAPGVSRDSVAWLVDHGPPTFQLVLATRTEPAIALGAVRAHGELVEIRADELKFTVDEAAALLNGALELGLTRDEIGALVDRTEGWPAGLYLAGLSLGGVRDRRSFVNTFGGSSRQVVDFLAAEVLDAHDPSTLDLMLRSSILERFCGSLCDAVLEQDGSEELLEALAEGNLFLIPLDEHGRWYRFHRVFAQLLQVELEHRHPGLVATLHRRAFAWHRDNGSVDAAIGHAIQARAYDEAGQLIASVWIDYLQAGRHVTVLAWLKRLPDYVLRENAELLVVQAWVSSLAGKRDAAASAIAVLERRGSLDDGPLSDGFSSLEASLAALRATINWGDVGAGIDGGRRAAQLEGPSSRWWPLICYALGGCLYFSGEFDEADRWLKQAMAPALALGQWRIAVVAFARASLIAGALGRVVEQDLFACEALQVAQDHDLEEVEGELYAALGASLAARGELEDALSALEQGIVVGRVEAFPRAIAELRLEQAAVLQAMGRHEAAVSVINEARAVVGACPDPRMLAERLAGVERSQQAQRRNGEETLSRRELVVLRMLGGPLSQRDIGRELYLSLNTIRSHTKSIYRKLGASSRAEALERAHERSLI